MFANSFTGQLTPGSRLDKVRFEDLPPALIYAGLTWLLHALDLAQTSAWGMEKYASWWPLPLAVGCLAILFRRLNVPLFAVVIALSGIGLLLVGSNCGFFLLFESVFTLVLLGGPRLSRTTEHAALVVTGLLVVLMYFVTVSAAISVTFGLVLGMTLLMPAEWASNVRKARNLADSEARTAAAVATAAAANAKAQLAEHEMLLARERTLMAREVHDVLSARLSAIALQSGAALASPGNPELASRAMQEIRDQSVKGIEELNAMIRTLYRENTLTPSGTVADMDGLVETYTGSGLRVNFRNDLPDGGTWLAAPVQSALYRALNESLVNFSKHAPNEALDLRLSLDEGAVEFTASNPLSAGSTDQLPSAPASGTGTGLRSMQVRSRELGGIFRAGATGGNFTLKMMLPLGET